MKERGSYLSSDEQQRRYKCLMQILEVTGCEAAVVVGSPQISGKRYFRYLTDWSIQSIGGYLVIAPGLPPVAVFRASSQAYWAKRVEWVQDIVATPRPIDSVIEWLAEHGVADRISLVGEDYFPVGDHRDLMAQFRGEVVDVTRQVDDLMATKSPEEQVLIRETSEVFDDAWVRVLEGAKPGMTEWEIASLAGSELLRRGVGHSVILMGASSSSASALCVGWPRNRVVDVDDVVQMSIEGPGPAGYSVEIGGMFSFRPPDSRMDHQFMGQVAGVEAGVEILKDGVPAADVAGAVADAFKAAGLESGYWAGHGIGLGIPEPPIIEATNEEALVEGMAIALHPNAVGDDGRGSLMSRTYLVGTSKGEPLSRVSLDWGELW